MPRRERNEVLDEADHVERHTLYPITIPASHTHYESVNKTSSGDSLIDLASGLFNKPIKHKEIPYEIPLYHHHNE